MKLLLARTAGFCGGVKTAMRVAVDAARRHGSVHSDGPLIHNAQAVELLSLRGVRTFPGPVPEGCPVLVRAHGLPPADRAAWEASGHPVIDATCGHVRRSQRLAADVFARGGTVVFAGDPGHAETLAVCGCAPGRSVVVSTLSGAEGLEIPGRGLFMAQTTFDGSLFDAMAEVLSRRFPLLEIEKTVCGATESRQGEARRLAGRADVLVVVGGRHSANTRRLAEIGREAGKPVFTVETADELDPGSFRGFRTAAVTAGASTPGWLTRDVVDRLRLFGPPTLSDRAYRLVRTAEAGRVLTALSAAGLALASWRLMGMPPRFDLAAAAGLYVFFAHILNRRVPYNLEARRFSAVDHFYRRHRVPLLTLAWVAAAAALGTAWLAGPGTFAVFFVSIAAALAYSHRVNRVFPFLRYAREVPGSRDMVAAAGWAAVAAGPAAGFAGDGWTAASTLAFVFLLCLGKAVVRDIGDIDGDHLLGLDTLPVFLGRKRSGLLAAAFLTASGALLSRLQIQGGEFRFLMLAVPAVCFAPLAMTGRWMNGREWLRQIMLDSAGCLAGLLAVAHGAAA